MRFSYLFYKCLILRTNLQLRLLFGQTLLFTSRVTQAVILIYEYSRFEDWMKFADCSGALISTVVHFWPLLLFYSLMFSLAWNSGPTSVFIHNTSSDPSSLGVLSLRIVQPNQESSKQVIFSFISRCACRRSVLANNRLPNAVCYKTIVFLAWTSQQNPDF